MAYISVVVTELCPRKSDLSDFLGHSSVKTTEIYAKISSKSRQEAVERAAANLITKSAYDEQEKSAIMEWLKNLL